VAKKAERAVETLRIPRDMVPLIQREADKAGVSKNEWMALVLAAAVGYRKPKN
jgi:predicted HicB family RNase H-like nuclease